MELALGLIETKGLIGAIEAADAMLKAANVKLTKKEKITAAMVTIEVVGEVAAVRAAVDAGAAAAQRVGQLISVHVIPRPDDQLEPFITESIVKPSTSKKEKKQKDVGMESLFDIKEEYEEQIETVSFDYNEFPEDSLEENANTVDIEEAIAEVVTEEEKSKLEQDLFNSDKEIIVEQQDTVKEESELKNEISNEQTPFTDLDKQELPQEKNSSVDDETKEMNKDSDLSEEKENIEDLIEKIVPTESDAKILQSDYQNLNVHKLRILARQLSDFPVKGRKLASASRTILIYCLDQLKKKIIWLN